MSAFYTAYTLSGHFVRYTCSATCSYKSLIIQSHGSVRVTHSGEGEVFVYQSLGMVVAHRGSCARRVSVITRQAADLTVWEYFTGTPSIVYTHSLPECCC